MKRFSISIHIEPRISWESPRLTVYPAESLWPVDPTPLSDCCFTRQPDRRNNLSRGIVCVFQLRVLPDLQKCQEPTAQRETEPKQQRGYNRRTNETPKRYSFDPQTVWFSYNYPCLAPLVSSNSRDRFCGHLERLLLWTVHKRVVGALALASRRCVWVY